MDGHFRAFSFVDRITRLDPGVSIAGEYDIPAGLSAFSHSLASEAVGQLAAWGAMAAVDFTHRPLAGIAGRIELLATSLPGTTLELSADLQSVDCDTTAYSGLARVNGVPVVRLDGCLGPMVSVDEFDDPAALRARFELLRGAGALPGVFTGVADPVLEWLPSDAASAQATLRVPAGALFFQDHFPRKQVFPGTLLTQAKLHVAAVLARQTPVAPGTAWVPRVVSDVKLRTFISPGQELLLSARPAEQLPNSLTLKVESRHERRLIGSANIQYFAEATA